jgi:hypothetical protein
MKKTTQEQVIIKLMIEDYTSALDAFKQAGTLKLCTRVGELRQHFKIIDRWVQAKNKFGNMVRFKEYKIVKPSKKALAVYGL